MKSVVEQIAVEIGKLQSEVDRLKIQSGPPGVKEKLVWTIDKLNGLEWVVELLKAEDEPVITCTQCGDSLDGFEPFKDSGGLFCHKTCATLFHKNNKPPLLSRWNEFLGSEFAGALAIGRVRLAQITDNVEQMIAIVMWEHCLNEGDAFEAMSEEQIRNKMLETFERFCVTTFDSKEQMYGHIGVAIQYGKSKGLFVVEQARDIHKAEKYLVCRFNMAGAPQYCQGDQ